ncbi:MAG: hypothetical protein DHS20C06_10200 [Hyphobacterium sp.]|nr:MAG: hypothetical protein DHS20C06_10200 [Hyphobacterium sp.]
MQYEQAESWLKHYGRAWEAGDSGLLATLFTETASYRDSPFNEPMLGHSAIIEYWNAGAGASQDDVKFSSDIWTVEGQIVIAHWSCRLVPKTAPRAIRFDGVFRLQFAPDLSERPLCMRLEEWWMSDA